MPKNPLLNGSAVPTLFAKCVREKDGATSATLTERVGVPDRPIFADVGHPLRRAALRGTSQKDCCADPARVGEINSMAAFAIRILKDMDMAIQRGHL